MQNAPQQKGHSAKNLSKTSVNIITRKWLIMDNEVVQLELNFNEEIWRDVVGYEGMYLISNHGRVQSLKRKGRLESRILRGDPDASGYLQLYLYRKQQRERVKIHKLVARAFIGERPERHVINHINGIKTDNRPENLEYCTSKENIQHAWKIGLMKSGLRGHKLTTEQIIEIRKLYKNGVSAKKLGEIFKVSRGMISSITQKKLWKHIPESDE